MPRRVSSGIRHLSQILTVRHGCSGKPLWGTLLALLHKGEPVLGIIDQPYIKERWVGVKGQTTTLNGLPSLSPSPSPSPSLPRPLPPALSISLSLSGCTPPTSPPDGLMMSSHCIK